MNGFIGGLVLETLVLPFGAALAATALARGAGLRRAGLAAGLGVLLGALAGQGRLAGLPALPPQGAVDKLPLLALGSLLLALAVEHLPARARRAALAVAVVLAVGWLAWPRLAAGHGAAYAVGGLLAVGGAWALGRLDAARGPAAPLTLMVAAVAAAGVALYGASSLMAQVIAAFTAAVAGAATGSPGFAMGPAGGTVAAALLLGAVAVLALYTQAAPLALLLLLAVFVAPAAAERIVPSGVGRAAAHLAAALLPAVAAVAVAMASHRALVY